jgi:galactan endo-beta-1,3-galactanase
MTTHSRRGVLGMIGAGLLGSAVLPPVTASAAPPQTLATEVLIDGSTFASYQAFEASWNYRYPWGADHNGTARMVASSSDHSHVSLAGGILTLQATHLSSSDGTSSQPPHLPIHYHSGAVHAKQQVLVDSAYPIWDIRGEFQAPSARGTWPAFWITGANSWPPESDILEYKGDARNWFNTYKNPSGAWSNSIVSVGSPGAWHEYRAVLTRLDGADVQIQYYLDGSLKGTHRAADFVGKPMWIIVNLQMEGSSGAPGPSGDVYYRARNIRVSRSTG